MMSSLFFAGFIWRSSAFEDFEMNAEDHIHLLQVQAKKHNRTAMTSPVNHHYAFDSCATFGGAPDIVGTGAFNPHAEDSDFGFCRCWGDGHCSSVPFDVSGERGRAGRYTYSGPGASRFAKAADGSWEVQIFQCGFKSRHTTNPSAQVGVAINAGGVVVEVGTANANTVQCYVNGELKPPGYEVHLPTGFHFRCPEVRSPLPAGHAWAARLATPAYGTFCAVKDGQFVASTNHWEWGNQANQVLAVPKNVDVQATNTVCYDPSSKDGQQNPHGGTLMSLTAIVPAEEVLFNQRLLDYMASAPNCLLQSPPQSAVSAGEPADPEALCNQSGPDAWQHAQDVCSPLQERHPSFYTGCLIDECVRANDPELAEGADDSVEAEIEEIADVDEPEVADEASAQGDPHITSSSGSRFDLLPSMVKLGH